LENQRINWKIQECPIHCVYECSSFITYKAYIFWDIPAMLRDTIKEYPMRRRSLAK
jgi:hypothetical protein